MLIYTLAVGLTFMLSLSSYVPPPATGVVFGDVEVSTMLTANKTVPATFFTNCVRTPLTVVLNSASTVDWMMTKGMASPTCSDSMEVWTLTPQQRQVWNLTTPPVKLAFLNAFNSYRAYALARPTATCVVSGLAASSPGPYLNVMAAPDISNPDRFLITLSKQPGGTLPGGPSGKE